MAQFSFLRTNEYRSYPFLSPGDLQEAGMSADLTDELPESTIVDFGSMLGLDADYDPTLHKIYLHQVRRTGLGFEFEFRNNVPGASHFTLVFTRAVNAAEFETDYATGTQIEMSGHSSSVSEACPAGDATWDGFLITGRLDDLAALLPSPGNKLTLAQEDYQIEPARIQSLAGSFIRSISLANYDRTHAIPPTDCGGEEPVTIPTFINASCLNGAINFKEGYNVTIRQDARSNALVVSASVGAGEGVPCEEVPLYPDEHPPAGSNVLTGGPRCSEIIKTINGVGGSNITLQAGDGVIIAPHGTLPNTLVVSINMTGFPICSD